MSIVTRLIALAGAIILSGLTGCGAPVKARFRDRPVVTHSDDRRAIDEPAEREFVPLPYMTDALLFDPIVNAVDRPTRTAAEDTNALDEVPDSTWFNNRIGVRPISPAAAARGADTVGPPVGPYTIAKPKRGGGNPGFVMADARGVKYLIKFDTAANPEQQTGANVVVNRIFWTLGYNVPADHVLYFSRGELSIPQKVRDKYDFDDAELDRILATGAPPRGGFYRATASQFLDGIPKGGWPRTETRADDPNDRVSHERRRVLRGLRVFAAWTGHTDLKEDNTLDMYLGEPGKGHLVHYLVDFGEALGGHQSEKGQLQVGWEHGWDWSGQLRAAASFGLWKRPWEGQRETPWKSIGHFGADHFDPRGWRERYPYEPFDHMDRTDAYWAARLVMEFDRPILEAIVAEAKFSSPEAAAYLVDTLLARRDKVGAAYLDGVTPLDDFELRDGDLCAIDVARHHGIRKDGVVSLDGGTYPIAADGTVCLPLPRTPGYHIMAPRIRTSRYTTPALQLHVVVDGGTREARLIGVVR
jgi:hypothetical protein